MQSKLLLISLLFFMTTVLFSSELVEEPEEKVEEIYKEIATTMLDTGSWGVDINPIKPLMSEGNYFAGGISYFDDSNGVEIAVPINYVKFSDSRSDYYGFDSKYNYDEIDFTLDLHIRKFSTNKVSGVFLGLFGRYTYLEGKLKDEDRLATQHKFGLGVEIGIRIRDIFNLPLYWGMSVAIGQYFGKSHNIFYSDNCIALEMDDEETFFDGELLKIGYEF